MEFNLNEEIQKTLQEMNEAQKLLLKAQGKLEYLQKLSEAIKQESSQSNESNSISE